MSAPSLRSALFVPPWGGSLADLRAPKELRKQTLVRARGLSSLALFVFRERCSRDSGWEAKALLGRFDETHPLVTEAASWGPVLAAGELVPSPGQGRYEEVARVAPGTRTPRPTGTAVRDTFAPGEELPEWFTRLEIALPAATSPEENASTITAALENAGFLIRT